MKIVIMGAGAIGSLYGGLLRLAGHDVILIGRPPHVSAIHESGLHIDGVMGRHVVPIPACDCAREVTDADFVVITTKSYDTAEAASEVAHIVDGGATVVVLQNGLGTERIVEKELATKRVLRATTCMGAVVSSPGHVVATGSGLTEVGTHHTENAEALSVFVNILRDAGFNVRASDNVDGVVWTKAIVNCGINPVGALTGLTNGEIYRSRHLRHVVIELVNEAVSVATALGVCLTTDDPIRYTLGTAKATAENFNSMLMDIQMGKRTEIDYLTGAVLQIGEQLGLDLPVSATVYALVKAIERRAVGTEAEAAEFFAPPELVGLISGL